MNPKTNFDKSFASFTTGVLNMAALLALLMKSRITALDMAVYQRIIFEDVLTDGSA